MLAAAEEVLAGGMDPGHMRWVAGQVQNGSFLLCPNGSRLAMRDGQETCSPGLVKLVKAVDAGRATVEFRADRRLTPRIYRALPRSPDKELR